jgi:ABC-2 type transport system permease protein
MTAFAQHFSFEFRVGLRNRDLLLLNYLFPLGFFLLMGTLMGSINPGFVQTMIPAMAMFAVMTGAILGLPNPLVEQREAGIFRSYKINGVPALSLLTIPAMSTAFHALIAAAIMTAMAPILFGAPLPANWLWFGVTLVITAFAFAGLGVLIGVISDNSRVTILWSQLIFLPSMILGGLMLPTSMLPPSLQKVAMLLPSTYSMQAFMGLAYQQTTTWNPLWSLAVLLGGGALAFIMAAYLFNWDNQNVTRGRPKALALIAMIPYVLGLLLAM